MRFGETEPHQLGGLVEMGGQRAHRAAEVWSRLAEKLSSIAFAAMRSWNALESRSPAPSSISDVVMLATPGLSAGSWLAPPRNAKSSATSGTVCSWTSHASMPDWADDAFDGGGAGVGGRHQCGRERDSCGKDSGGTATNTAAGGRCRG